MHMSQIGVSQIDNCFLHPVSIDNRKNETQGAFGSLLRGLMDNQEFSIQNKQTMFSIMMPYLEQFSNIDGLSNSEFIGMITTIQNEMKANGINVPDLFDFNQMSDSDIEGMKSHMQERFDFMQKLTTTGSMFGIGGIYGNTEMAVIQLFLDTLSSTLSSFDDESEGDGLILQHPEFNTSFQSASDFLSFREYINENGIMTKNVLISDLYTDILK